MPEYCLLDERDAHVVLQQHRPTDCHGADQLNSLIAYNNTRIDNPVKFCTDDFQPAGFCAGCQRPILDRFFLQAVDAVWHLACLRCSVCQVVLDSEPSCFAKNGAIFCRDDYYKQFGSRSCARCGICIGGSELVMRARDLVFHLNCFSCARCQRVLHTGEVYGLRGPLPYCREDLGILDGGGGGVGMIPGLPPGHLGPPVTPHGFFAPHPSLSRLPGFYPGAFGALSKGRSRKKRGDMDSTDDMFDRGHDDYCLNSPPRQKRMRTSFKHHQLRTMKSYFGLNHNPDAKDLKSLAEKTGLSKRVLQVWFQNARAKYRRSLLRQDSQGGGGNKSGGTGGGDSCSGGEEGDGPRRNKGEAEEDDDALDPAHDDDDMVEDSPLPTLDGEEEEEEEMLGDQSVLSSAASDLSLSPPAMPEFNGSMGGHTGTDSDTCGAESGNCGISGGHISSATAALYASS